MQALYRGGVWTRSGVIQSDDPKAQFAQLPQFVYFQLKGTTEWCHSSLISEINGMG